MVRRSWSNRENPDRHRENIQVPNQTTSFCHEAAVHSTKTPLHNNEAAGSQLFNFFMFKQTKKCLMGFKLCELLLVNVNLNVHSRSLYFHLIVFKHLHSEKHKLNLYQNFRVSFIFSKASRWSGNCECSLCHLPECSHACSTHEQTPLCLVNKAPRSCAFTCVCVLLHAVGDLRRLALRWSQTKCLCVGPR